MNLKDVVSTIYSPLMATGALVLTVMRDRRDNSKLAVNSGLRYLQRRRNADGDMSVTVTQAGRLYWSDREDDPGEVPFFHVRLLCTNTGRRPITVVSWHFSLLYPEGSQGFGGGSRIDPSITLKESEACVIDIKDVEHRLPSPGALVLGITIQDSSGRDWHPPAIESAVCGEAIDVWLQHQNDEATMP